MDPATLATLVLLVPLASAALVALFLRRRGGMASAVSVAAATALAAGAGYLALRGGRFAAHVEWFRLGDFRFSFGILFDDLAALMLSIVAVVGLCVHVFSLGYMRDDVGKARYFGGLSIFMFSMTGIVLADNLFMMFVFWELVGFSSWLLINHWHERPAASDAAKKAFIVNRVGDFGFLLGIILCYWRYGTVNLGELGAHAGAVTAYTSRAIPLLLFCGAVGKSAQLPLQVWLPDAMEGPTPVSALIHAATMVAAGIYMLCRIQVLMVPEALTVILWVGTATALYAALCAIVQTDIKKVLAYSTLSQLGYMVAAFGLGSAVLSTSGSLSGGGMNSGVGAAMFHLTTHASFKALLFLASGAVILACHHEQDIFRMGGLAGRMKFTFATFTIGVAAISGLPFFSGFFSKDAILYLAFANNRAVFAILALTAALTAFYMARLWWVVFLGSARTEGAAHAHEGGWSLTAPLGVLAALAAVGGYLGLYPRVFSGVLSMVPEAGGADHAFILVTSIVVLVVGAGTALLLYGGAAAAQGGGPSGPPDVLERKAPILFGALVRLRSSFDRAYDYYVAKVQQRVALVLNFFDVIVLAGFVVRGAAGVAGLVGLGARALNVGRTNVYVAWLLAGVVLLWILAAR
jgi:NADH-quinone oxidoreductase subunit L